jgi:hypothetical protein
VSRWEPSPLLTESWPVPLDDMDDAMVTLSRCPWIDDWRALDTGHVQWTLRNGEDRDCKHHKIKTVIARVVSLRAAIDWEG